MSEKNHHPFRHHEGDITARINAKGVMEYVIYHDRQWVPCDGKTGTPDLRPKPVDSTHYRDEPPEVE